jgi:hypothetical protein
MNTSQIQFNTDAIRKAMQRNCKGPRYSDEKSLQMLRRALVRVIAGVK